MSSLVDKAQEAEKAGDAEGALKYRREIALKKQSADHFCVYGKAAEKLKRWEEAETAYKEALRLDPDSSLVMICLGNLMLDRRDGNRKEFLGVAKDWFLKALQYKRTAGTLTFLGTTYYELNDMEAAHRTFEEAVKVNPDYEEALYNLAYMEKKQNPERAIKLLERAIEIDPYYAAAHHHVALLYQKAGDLERAEHHLRRTLENDPEEYWTHLYLANCLAVQGKDDEAEEEYRYATNSHPEIVGGFEFFARFLEDIGKIKEAAEARSKVIYKPGEAQVRPHKSRDR